ncbi:MAG: VCBS repeat-containing protein [Planctomycetota bacterium]|nr:MAG: VCBS repeat-containing protein [Planctomycetota bacterium]
MSAEARILGRALSRPLCLLLLGSPLLAQSGFGSESLISTAADGPQHLASGDLDRDGDLDIVVAAKDGDAVYWFENDGQNPPSWTSHLLGDSANDPLWVHVADVNSDGKLDVLVCWAASARLSWFESDGGHPPAFTEHLISPVAASVRAATTVDLDRDGDLDVIASESGGNRIVWYENSGSDPPFWTGRTIDPNASNPRQILAVDPNADGDVDLVAAVGDQVVLYHNNGSQPPAWTEEVLASGWTNCTSVAATDIDRDGDLDLFATSLGLDSVYWLENMGAGNWLPSQIFDQADGARSLAVGDVTGNGVVDLIVGSQLDDSVRWLQFDAGSKTGWQDHLIGNGSDELTSVNLGDFDGDGLLDVAAVSQADDKLVWFENLRDHRAAAFHQAVPVPASVIEPEDLEVADLDQDGDLDFAVVSFGDDQLSWFENLGGKPLQWQQHSIDTQVEGARAVVIHDLDRDGDLDLITGAFHGDSIDWWENLGGSPLQWQKHDIPHSLNGVYDLAVGDLDSDGDPDIAVAPYHENKIIYLENDGAAVPGFGNGYRVAAPVRRPKSVFLEDLDHDGDLDVLFTSYFDHRIGWARNDSKNSQIIFVPQLIWDMAVGARAVTTGDVDRDGDVDILAASVIDNTIWFLESDGASQPSWTAQEVHELSKGARGVAAADLDRDGEMEIVSASFFDAQIGWFDRDDVNPAVWHSRLLDIQSIGAISVRVADFDQDGDPDVLGAARGNGSLVIYRNASGPRLQPLNPGSAGASNDVLLSNAAANAMLQFYWSETGGWTPTSCPGFDLNMGSPIAAGNPFQADGAGNLHTSVFVGPGMFGRTIFLQAWDAATCELSNQVIQTFN